MYRSSLVLILGLFTAARCQHNIVRRDMMTYFTRLFGPPMACRATLKNNYGGVTLQKCLPFSDMEGVTMAAQVKKIDVQLVIQSDGKPGLEISFKALTPSSEQKYKINVVHSIDGTIYCGIVSTQKPIKEVLHEISLIMTCLSNTLTHSVGVHVAVNPTINGVKKGDNNKNYTMPYCNDAVMIKTTECAGDLNVNLYVNWRKVLLQYTLEYRRNRIKLNLQQVNNGLKVVIDMKLAYRGNRSTKINLQLRLRRPGKGVNGFVDVGDIVTLTYPQNTYVFKNLVHGEHYRVLTWRDTDYARYIRDLTLEKSNRRRKRHSNLLSRTLQK